MNHGLKHGLIHLGHFLLEKMNEYIENHPPNNNNVQGIKTFQGIKTLEGIQTLQGGTILPTEGPSFIWVSQEIRNFAWTVVDLVEKGKTIPEELFIRDPKSVYDILKKCDRLDLIPAALITPALKKKYPEFNELKK
jgi:hypothetical protein